MNLTTMLCLTQLPVFLHFCYCFAGRIKNEQKNQATAFERALPLNSSPFSCCITFILKPIIAHVTLPERIYNSHYGNGVLAMFTS